MKLKQTVMRHKETCGLQCKLINCVSYGCFVVIPSTFNYDLSGASSRSKASFHRHTRYDVWNTIFFYHITDIRDEPVWPGYHAL